MQAEVVAFCHDKGWSGPNSAPKTFGDCMALLHSEVSEALEAYRVWGTEDMTGATCQTTPDGTHFHDLDCKPEGVGSEFADVLIRLLDDCDRFGIDLQAEYERKMAYNNQRPWRHGGKAI